MAESETDCPPRTGLVLIADGDPNSLEWARFVLESEGYDVVAVQTAPLLMELAIRHRKSLRLVLCGSGLSDTSTDSILQFLSDNLRDIPIIMRVQQLDGIGQAQELNPSVGVLAESLNAVQLAVMVREILSVKARSIADNTDETS